MGATAEEILEACAVAISLGGTMGAGETTRVVQFLDGKGLLEEQKNARCTRKNNRHLCHRDYGR